MTGIFSIISLIMFLSSSLKSNVVCFECFGYNINDNNLQGWKNKLKDVINKQ